MRFDCNNSLAHIEVSTTLSKGTSNDMGLGDATSTSLLSSAVNANSSTCL